MKSIENAKYLGKYKRLFSSLNFTGLFKAMIIILSYGVSDLLRCNICDNYNIKVRGCKWICIVKVSIVQEVVHYHLYVDCKNVRMDIAISRATIKKIMQIDRSKKPAKNKFNSNKY